MSSIKDAYTDDDGAFEAMIEAFMTGDDMDRELLMNDDMGDVPCPMCREWTCDDPDACEAEYSGDDVEDHFLKADEKAELDFHKAIW